MNLIFYLFSYNRGLFLRNCVESIRRNAPGYPIVIVDDDSNDPETLEIIDNFPPEIRIIRQKKKKVAKLGGLYRNMQLAFEDMAEDQIFVFLQDDTQIVRPIEEDDLAYIRDYFETYPQAAFLNPHFLKGVRRRGILKAIAPAAEFPVYFYDFSERLKDRSVTMYYTDICVGHAGRMRQAGYSYQDNESTSGVRARELFSKMGTMAHPFMMSLPEVPIYRGKEKTLGVAWAEKRMGIEPKRFKDMDADEVAAFKSRDLSVLPFAEEFLTCIGKQPKKPFVKESVNAYPFLRLLHKIELFFRKRFGGK
jgi:glycosyltransferase involved in cell wall biosynthesis